MNTFEDIQDIWQAGPQKGGLPDAHAIIAQVKKQHQKMLRKSIFGAVSLSLTAVFITILGFTSTFKYPTTYVAMVIVVLTTISGVIATSKLSMPVRINKHIQDSTSAYLDSLIAYRNRQKFYVYHFFGYYYIALSVGMAMYLFEFLARDLRFGIIAYAMTFAWFAFAWFYLRKRTIRKQQAKMDAMISRLEALKKGF